MKQMEMIASTLEDTESEHSSRSSVSSHDQISSPSNAIESISLDDGEVEVLMTSNVRHDRSLSPSPRGQTDDDSDVEITHCSIKEPSTWMQVRSYYRKWQRMHPYADEKMKLKHVLTMVEDEFKKFHSQKIKSYHEENARQRGVIKMYDEKTNQQTQRIHSLEEQFKAQDEQIKLLGEKLSFYKARTNRESTDETESGKLSNADEPAEIKAEIFIKEEPSTSSHQETNREDVIKSQSDRIELLEKELVDLNYRVKKQEMQIQFLETDLKYKDKAESTFTENAQRQEIKIQLLEVELNYRKNIEDTLKLDKERLESKISELTKSWCSLKCENLSLNEILKEKKPSDHHGADCCDTVTQVKLSFIDLIETEFECVICNGMFIEATVTKCNHIFCHYCLSEWRKKSPNCPICRSYIMQDFKTTIIDNFILNTAKLISDKMYTERKKQLEERKSAKNASKFKRLRVL